MRNYGLSRSKIYDFDRRNVKSESRVFHLTYLITINPQAADRELRVKSCEQKIAPIAIPICLNYLAGKTIARYKVNVSEIVTSYRLEYTIPRRDFHDIEIDVTTFVFVREI